MSKLYNLMNHLIILIKKINFFIGGKLGYRVLLIFKLINKDIMFLNLLSIISFIVYKRVSDTLVVSRFSRTLNMSLTPEKLHQYRALKYSGNKSTILKLLGEDLLKSLDKLERGVIYKTSTNHNIMAIMEHINNGTINIEYHLLRKYESPQPIEKLLLIDNKVLRKALRRNQSYKKLRCMLFRVETMYDIEFKILT